LKINEYELLAIVNALLSAISQVLLNYSNRKKHKNKLFEYLNVYVVMAYILLAISLIVNSYILKYISLMESCVITSSSYIFVLLISRAVLKEKITENKLIGNLLVILGIIIFLN
jgi:drug/metabolite transporter (DMT)-like permease